MDAKRLSSRPARAGFTLVELLAVLVIIGILVGLITAAVMGARTAARRAKILLEIDNLSTALNAYKEKFGEYPPDCSGLTNSNAAIYNVARRDFMRHMLKAFPRLSTKVIGTNPDPLQQFYAMRDYIRNSSNVAIDPLNGQLDPSTALVFFLGGLPTLANTGSSIQVSGSSRMAGFAADPTNPFLRSDQSSSRIPPFFDFDPARLTDYSGNPPDTSPRWYRYVPDTGSTASAMPYIYFKAKGQGVRFRAVNQQASQGAYDNSFAGPGYDVTGTWGVPQVWQSNLTRDVTTGNAELVSPYVICKFTSGSLVADRWPGHDSFQIISAGIDGKYGLSNFVPPEAGNKISSGARPASQTGTENDNLTSFSKGTLEDMNIAGR